MSPHRHRPPEIVRLALIVRLWPFLLAPLLAHGASDGPSRAFDVAADRAERSLKVFSEQSGRGVLFVTDAVAGFRTNLVKGDFTPAEALEILLRNTGLVSSQDGETGAFAVRRATPEESKNGHRAARKTTCDRPTRRNRPLWSRTPRRL